MLVVWCVFLQLWISVNSVNFFLLKLCGWGGESQSCFEVLVLFVLSIIPYLIEGIKFRDLVAVHRVRKPQFSTEQPNALSRAVQPNQ